MEDLKDIKLLCGIDTLYYFVKTNEAYDDLFLDIIKIGFKDKEKNIRLHNIQVQLQGIGIYTIGLKPLLKYINDELLKDIRDDLLPVTRADINCFVNYDFSFIDKTMFVSRKKRYFTIKNLNLKNQIKKR